MMTNNCNRYVVLAMGCCVLTTAGSLGSLISIENDFKKRLHISQKQRKRRHFLHTSAMRSIVFFSATNFQHSFISVELVISLANLGLCIGLPAGLILERFGPRWASLCAMILSLMGFSGLCVSVVYPEEFGGSLFWLLNICAIFAGKFVICWDIDLGGVRDKSEVQGTDIPIEKLRPFVRAYAH